MEHILIYIPLATLLGLAVFTDLRWGKVFNWLTAPALALGLLLNGVLHGTAGLVAGLEGAGLALAVYIVLSLFGRLLGAGDAKLMMAVGAFVGPSLLGWAMAYGAIIGGVLAVLMALSRRRLCQEVASMGQSVLLRTFAGYRLNISATDSLRMPYAIPLALGVLAALIVHGGGMLV
ncbi:MAG: prepilin peptidase [Armatimonadetes bacterium]|nr:prepilin peptidase [Armatimonadota bacterium]